MLPDSFSKGSKENQGSGIRRRLDNWYCRNWLFLDSTQLSLYSKDIIQFLHTGLPEDFFCGVMVGPTSFFSYGEAALPVEF